ncbi:MarR family winged helix-turn-helix transcriptional regulator [Streptomyces aureocirculatus]|uniref:MarR family winged helix-turn-helix transcriptional regulator n=1 Tax=Streptomyces aureocirculatus TaxID=67275 RepID=UPI0004C89129|nr:MarR family transcriptional regulator [Streptomyces aureocirculatus]
MSDAVDAIVGQWEKERPELADDLWPVQLIARVQRANRIVERELKAFCAEHGVEVGEFDVLTTLRRSGPPYALTAGAFLKAAMVTSGAITNRIDRMEVKGLVERVRDTADRRTVKIRLTGRGQQLTDILMAGHLRNQARILGGIDPAEMDRAVVVLRTFLELHGDTSIT